MVLLLRLVILMSTLASCVPSQVSAECRVLSSSEPRSGLFSKHLSGDCPEHEREAEAVTASELLAALKDGADVDLAGVIVTGKLALRVLPTASLSDVSRLPQDLRERVHRSPAEQVRVMRGDVSIRDSIVRGEVVADLKKGYLLAAGRITLTGTTFERPVDLSRVLFLQPVDFSESIFRRECYLVRAQFLQEARFEKVSFGPRARFFQAHFRERVTFVGSGFGGMGEFLEVSFDEDASFSRAYFKMGTGFGGSRFRGILDFSEAIFEREAFFTHAVFERDAFFRRATFRGHADFSEAHFKGVDDFSKAFFEKEPRFFHTKTSGERATLGGLQDTRVLYGIAAALLLFTIVFLVALRKF